MPVLLMLGATLKQTSEEDMNNKFGKVFGLQMNQYSQGEG